MQQLDSASALTTSCWHGELQLAYARVGDNTRVVQSQNKAPLKVQRPFYPEGQEVCHSIILHTAGGIVGGDCLSLNLHLQSGSQALVTTAAASKIYRSEGLESQQSIQISIADGACLEWLPQETIVFEQAHYRQDMRVELAPGASWLGWEITRFGRSARDEKFLAGNWRSYTEVWQANRPLWIDRQWLPGNETVFHSPHGLAGCPVVGSFAWIGQAVEPEFIQVIRELWAVDQTGGEVGITRLQAGLLCRYRGHSTAEARQKFIQVWQFVRQSFLGRSLCIPRVWQL